MATMREELDPLRQEGIPIGYGRGAEMRRRKTDTGQMREELDPLRQEGIPIGYGRGAEMRRRKTDTGQIG
ncbi:hypothetical protein QE152_g40676 [Popillia japonica]|uniref:Uncharacterized protein n=1 Tax=Popillia japonica TaxID=7064 RepID=A0AAW1HFP0_POPJA